MGNEETDLKEFFIQTEDGNVIPFKGIKEVRLESSECPSDESENLKGWSNPTTIEMTTEINSDVFEKLTKAKEREDLLNELRVLSNEVTKMSFKDFEKRLIELSDKYGFSVMFLITTLWMVDKDVKQMRKVCEE